MSGARRWYAVALLCFGTQRIQGFIPWNRPWTRTVAQKSKPSVAPLAAEATTLETNASPCKATAKVPSEPRHLEIKLLSQALKSFNSSAAKTLVENLGAMRSNGTDPSEIDALLDSLLAYGPDSTTRKFWARCKPLARFSNNCRMESLRRTLDITTPPSSDGESDDNEQEDRLRRRRRALVSLLRQLAAEPEQSKSFPARLARRFWKTPAICIIESKARRELKSTSLSPGEREELRSRMGHGLETPKYDILAQTKDGSEIRRYQPFTVCSVCMGTAAGEASPGNESTSDKPKVGAGSFNTLAGYLFGKNQQQKPMKMTTPVLMDGEGSTRQMSFVLPSEYWSSDALSNAPQPIQGSGVSLAVKESQTRAVVMFGGYASKSETNKRKEQLMSSLANNKEWEPVNDATITLSQYNDPFTPPWKRLNEVSISVQPEGQ